MLLQGNLNRELQRFRGVLSAVPGITATVAAEVLVSGIYLLQQRRCKGRGVTV